MFEKYRIGSAGHMSNINLAVSLTLIDAYGTSLYNFFTVFSLLIVIYFHEVNTIGQISYIDLCSVCRHQRFGK